jgi:hypothetical protein
MSARRPVPPPFDAEIQRDCWSKFFWSDWSADERLGACSYAARGLWMELLSLMARSVRKGYLLVGGVAPDHKMLLRLTRGSSLGELRRALEELQRNGVYSTDEAGIAFSRRMVRDAARQARNRDNGRQGGNPRLTGSDKPPQQGSDNRDLSQSDKPQKLEATSQRLDARSETESAEPLRDSPPAPALIVFSCVGTGAKEWRLMQGQVTTWSAAFPALDIPAECRRARAWLDANQSRRKTARGMPSFLVAWFNRAVDRPSSAAGPGRAGKSPSPLASSWHSECELLHGSACETGLTHSNRLRDERERAQGAS